MTFGQENVQAGVFVVSEKRCDVGAEFFEKPIMKDRVSDVMRLVI